MTQGFALRCVMTGSAYKDGKIEKFYFCIVSPSKSFYMHFRSQRNAAQIRASHIPALIVVTQKATALY